MIFTVSGTGFKFLKLSDQVGDVLKRDPWSIANGIAKSLQQLLDFYVNFILLQGLGLFPFRLLEIGSVSLYPITRIGAKTPRDYAELVQPPTFRFGFYLPTALLIFIICIVYSVLRSSWQVLLAGLVYFALGHFVYKYQLLYAMESQQQATGRAWVMICDRIFLGLVFFQIATTGQLLLKRAVARGALMLPLIIATIWISLIYGKRYKPLMKFIALRSVRLGEQYADHDTPPDTRPESPADLTSTSSNDLAPERHAWAENDDPQQQNDHDAERPFDITSNEIRKSSRRFINPSLVTPLHKVWIADGNVKRQANDQLSNDNEIV